jgi:glycosyltransferase involved in cell wall biosynthesis
MREIMIRTGMPASKAVVLRNTIELPPIDKRAQRQDRQVLLAGRLSPEKTPRLALSLAEQLADAEVVVAGNGPMLAGLRDEATRRKLANVRFTGHVDHDQMGTLLGSAGAVVLTSRWFENSPQIMLEAMAAGRCVIAPDHPPLREWISDGQTGRLFTPGDADSLTRATRELLSDPSARQRMEASARELVTRRHDTDVLMNELEALYEEAIRRCASR